MIFTTVISRGVGDATVAPVRTDLRSEPAAPDPGPQIGTTQIGTTETGATETGTTEISITQIGIASWYGFDHQGKLTASGKPFDARKLTAAHPTLPLNSKAKVTNLGNGKSVEVTITDRGPGAPGRAIDLSERAATRLGMKKSGLALVEIKPLPRPESEVALE